MAIRINRVYTRGGDSGETSLVGGRRIAKDAIRIESYGTVDELNAILGLVRTANRDATFLENTIDDLNAALPELRSFVLPGGGWVSAFLHQARTVCRRAERLVTTLARQEAVGTHALIYLNRLSDRLFVLCRWAAKTRQEPEPLWNPTKS